MQSYSMRDVERVLQLPRSTLQGLVRAGFVRPDARPAAPVSLLVPGPDHSARRPRAHAGQHPAPRIRRSLGQLRERLPEAMPLSGLAICAVGDRVVVREGANHWQADDGQYLLGLDVSVQNGTLRVIEHRQRAAAPAPAAAPDDAPDAVNRPVSTYEWFGEAMRLEALDARGGARCLRARRRGRPRNCGGMDQLGPAVAREGRAARRERVYRRALAHCAPTPCCSSTWGCCSRTSVIRTAPLAAYHAAISEDPRLRRLPLQPGAAVRVAGKPQHAIRHLGQYRRLVTRHEH